jgi:phosphatidylglycerophosphate synthase
VIDRQLRARLAPALEPVARRAAARGVSAGAVTAAGLVVGIGACVAAALALWPLALALWLLNRVIDGLDGPLARIEGPTDLGGLYDFLADFVVYGGFVVGVAIAEPDARVACAALLAAYLLNNVALLSFSSLIEKRGIDMGDERALRFTGGLTEGFETIVAYGLICLFPGAAEAIAWVFTGMVLLTVVQRIALARQTLGAEALAPDDPSGARERRSPRRPR